MEMRERVPDPTPWLPNMRRKQLIQHCKKQSAHTLGMILGPKIIRNVGTLLLATSGTGWPDSAPPVGIMVFWSSIYVGENL